LPGNDRAAGPGSGRRRVYQGSTPHDPPPSPPWAVGSVIEVIEPTSLETFTIRAAAAGGRAPPRLGPAVPPSRAGHAASWRRRDGMGGAWHAEPRRPGGVPPARRTGAGIPRRDVASRAQVMRLSW